jgi:hypothetical protein
MAEKMIFYEGLGWVENIFSIGKVGRYAFHQGYTMREQVTSQVPQDFDSSYQRRMLIDKSMKPIIICI